MTRELRERIRAQGMALGFVRLGFTTAAPLAHDDALQRWLDAGMAGSMSYITRTRAQRADPRALLPAARTAVVAVARYDRGSVDPPAPGRGRIARYARGADYHHVLHARLRQLAVAVQQLAGIAIESRVVVDSAPLLERELAMRAGVGFIGKNTVLLSPGAGSYTVLGTLLLSLELPPDDPATPRCGSCDLCLTACPTGALVQPFVLDARRCISYLTIEHRDEIEDALRPAIGSWIFGCDECQQVCPFNAPRSCGADADPDPDLEPADPQASLDLARLLHLRSGEYRRLVRGRALARAPRRAWRRNAAIAAANVHDPDPALRQSLDRALEHEDPAIRAITGSARGRDGPPPTGSHGSDGAKDLDQ